MRTSTSKALETNINLMSSELIVIYRCEHNVITVDDF